MTTNLNTIPFRRHALVLALALTVGNSHAATITVSGTCTLINAINNANSDSDTDGAGGCPAGNGADSLNLKANKVYTLNTVNNQNQGPNGLPFISSVITINGNGASIRRSNAVGTPDFRLFRITSSGELTLNSLKLSGGHLTASYLYGGAINNNGHLTLNNSTVSGNSNLGVGSIGSGIANTYQSTLTLNNSTISGNTAARGGGIMSFPVTTSIIDNSTISDNVATSGGIGGIGNAGTMTLTNSTISNNRSLVNWGVGGIANSSDGSLTLSHSTISNNSTAYGNVAGLQNSGQLTMINSIAANSINGSDCYTNTNYGGATVFQGQSIIEDGTCNATHSGDPKLASLLDNGGPTLTHALRKGSAAINFANALCVAIDQRYVSRPQPTGGICDIGAFERIGTIPTEFASPIPFFDNQAANGGLVGIGHAGIFKLDAVRNQLLTAINYKIGHSNAQACSQLAKTITRLDSDNTPDKDDYVTGNQVSELIAQINTLRTSWTCP